MNVSPAVLGVIRSLGFVVILALVHWLSDAANLHGIMNEGLATLIATIALSFDHSLEAKTGTAAFGAVTRS